MRFLIGRRRLTHRRMLISAILVTMLVEPSLAAKTDVRGVRIGMSRDQARMAMANIGVQCTPGDNNLQSNCFISENNDRSIIQLEYTDEGFVWKMDYTFHARNNVLTIKKYLENQYGLSNERLVGRNNNGSNIYAYSAYGNVEAAIQFGVNNQVSFILLNKRMQPTESAMPKL